MPLGTRFLCVSLALLVSSQVWSQSYSVTDLGVLSAGGYSFGYGINANGEVAGQVGTNPADGFVWSATQGMKALPPLPGNTFSWATGINASGVVSGQSVVVENGSTYFHAVTWTNGNILDLGTLAPPGTSAAYAINAAGEVVGYSTIGGQTHAILWTKATGMQDLGTLPGGYYALGEGVNRYGQVVGVSYTSGGNFGFVWSKSTGMQNLGTLSGGAARGGGGSGASAINDLGQIAGGSGCGQGCFHPVLWSPKVKVQDLGLLSGSDRGTANGINNHGQVVGVAYYSGTPNHAFVWSQTAGMQDLNTLIPANSGWLLLWASAINDSGQITGQGTINGENHAFLLTPTASSESQQPVN